MTPAWSTLLLLMTIHAHQLLAATQSTTIELGGKTIHAPAPSGFHEISELSPGTRELAETMTPATNHLLAVFVTEGDRGRILKGESPELSRYMFLQSPKDARPLDVSEAFFQQLAGEYKRQQAKLFESVKAKIGLEIDKALGERYGASLRFGDQVPLGVFLDRPNVVGSAIFSKIQVSAAGSHRDELLVGAFSLMRVRERILFAYVYGRYGSQEDLEWVRSTSTAWVEQILHSNVSQAPVWPLGARRDVLGQATPGQSIGSRLFSVAMQGAVSGGAIGLLLWIVIRFRG
jgi:hypothetical protein